ncbi:MAG: hypothetical protein ACD_78C00100G0004 [uncultured bacterium (gcode 4)]|uniref:Uncharacterized protein n=1 Tax=uncultured bacterium (gcode 4) TaxID=1234023 RepID=K1XZ90_9BACT|nr:MAG: hypothetical protein ACD_78C00100G0004 [uncultured bacterium (gcode 4)]
MMLFLRHKNKRFYKYPPGPGRVFFMLKCVNNSNFKIFFRSLPKCCVWASSIASPAGREKIYFEIMRAIEYTSLPKTRSKNAQLGSGHFWVSGLRWVHSVKALRRSMWKDHGRRGVPNRGTTFTVFVWMTYPPWGDLLERHFRLFSLFFIGIRERNITTTRKIIFESQLYSSPTVFASLFSIKETKRLYFYLKKFLLEASEVIRFVAVLGE